jgi:phage/plasmid-like protein (TIGR03299 family)
MDVGALRAHATPRPVFWEGVGTKLNGSVKELREALDKSGLDFTVDKKPIAIITPDREFPDDPTRVEYITSDYHHATYRTDTNRILGVVGPQYEVLQNIDCFNFVDDLVTECGGEYATAGSLGYGERIYVSVKLPNVVSLGEDDDIEQYFFITTSHDGSGKVIVGFTNIRIACQNLLIMAVSKARHRIDIKHTANMQSRMDIAKMVIYEQTKYHREFQNLWILLKELIFLQMMFVKQCVM